jgi:hypothetical protein
MSFLGYVMIIFLLHMYYTYTCFLNILNSLEITHSITKIII